MDKKGALFAKVKYATSESPAAAFKGVTLGKKTELTALVFQHLDNYEVYRRMIVKSAMQIDGNDIAKVEAFTPGEAWFVHDNPVFSIVSNKKDAGKKYLYHVPLKVKGVKYLVNGEVVPKEEYAKYLTPSKAKDLLNRTPKTHKRGGFKYDIILRTVGVENITCFKARGITITM